MRIILLLAIICYFWVPALAQSNAGNSERTTVYKDFQPAVILLSDGKSINEKSANIFLKNGALLYKHNRITLQAEMSKIKSVKFADKEYVRVDTMLAYIVDTMHNNKLLCATLIDVEAYKSRLLYNRQITNFEIRSQVSVTSNDNSSDEDKLYPLINYFFFEVDGKVVRAHERVIHKLLPKEKQRMYKTIIQSPNFDWQDKNSLMKLLNMLSNNTNQK